MHGTLYYYANIWETLLQSLHLLRKDIYSPAIILYFFLSLTDFQELKAKILQVKREENGMTIAYLHDISALLSLVAAVREKDINCISKQKEIC